MYLLSDIIGQEDFFDLGRHSLGVELLRQRRQLVDAVRRK